MGASLMRFSLPPTPPSVPDFPVDTDEAGEAPLLGGDNISGTLLAKSWLTYCTVQPVQGRHVKLVNFYGIPAKIVIDVAFSNLPELWH